jgi:hypothetical protein
MNPNPPPSNSKAHSAQLARVVSKWVQLFFGIALFVLWRMRHWPFWDAAELCVVAGMGVYSGLNIYAALRVASTGPIMVARVSRFVAIILYVIMRYVYHDPLWRALLVWAVLWIVSALLVRRARRRALGGSPIAISSISP